MCCSFNLAVLRFIKAGPASQHEARMAHVPAVGSGPYTCMFLNVPQNRDSATPQR